MKLKPGAASLSDSGSLLYFSPTYSHRNNIETIITLDTD